MTKTEIKKAADNEIIYRYIKAYSSFSVNLNLGGKTKSLEKELANLDEEMLSRGILTKEQIENLNK